MPKGYEQNYQGIVHLLADCDFEEAAARLGLDAPVNGVVKISFLGREYEINSTGVTVTDGKLVHPNYLSTLIFYITSKGRAEPENTYSYLHSFIPESLGGFNNLSTMTSPLFREFGNNYGKFANAMKSLGAVNEETANEKEHLWSYRILPKIPMQVVYYEADEEFPCEIKLKLDNCAKKFLEFEQLAFLCGCFTSKLAPVTMPVPKTGCAVVRDLL